MRIATTMSNTRSSRIYEHSFGRRGNNAHALPRGYGAGPCSDQSPRQKQCPTQPDKRDEWVYEYAKVGDVRVIPFSEEYIHVIKPRQGRADSHPCDRLLLPIR